MKRSNQHFLPLKSLPIILCCGIGTSLGAQAILTPIPVSGFNTDTVVGIGATSPYADDAEPVDPEGSLALYESGLPGSSEGLPANGLIVVSPSRSYQFMPDTINNTLIMQQVTDMGYSPTGTLTFDTPVALSALSLLTSSGFSDAGVTYTSTLMINYVGGAQTQYNWNTYEAFSNPTFQSNEGLAISNLGRVDLANDSFENSSTFPNLFYVDIDLSSDPNLGTGIVSLSFDISGSALGHPSGVGSEFDSNANIYAVSGAATAVPEPSETAIILLLSAGLFVLIRQRQRVR